MTIDKLIKNLENLRDKYGPHIEVVKQLGSIQITPIKQVRLEDSDEDPSNWTISL